MQLIFTFTINTETNEAAFGGNVEPSAALQVLQNLVIADGIRRAQASREASLEKGKAGKKGKHDG